MPYDLGSMDIFAKRPSFDLGVSGGVRGMQSPSMDFFAPLARTITPSPSGGGLDIMGLIGQLAAGGLGAYGLGGYMNQGFDYDPYLTPERANSLVQSQEQRAYSNIWRQAGQAKQNVSSNFLAHGLGSSGAQIGDIAGIDLGAMQAGADVQGQLAALLGQLLQGIDTRALQAEMFKTQVGMEKYGTIGDLGLTAMLGGGFGGGSGEGGGGTMGTIMEVAQYLPFVLALL